MRLGVVLPVEGEVASRRAVLDAARAAEELGFDSVWTTDRVLQPGAPPGGYPYSQDRGAVAFRTGRLWLEPITTMSLVAAVTERVRIGTNVLVLPYRHPAVLAQQLATLDLLSDGRLVLGAGIGWMAAEFEALGVDRSERAPRTDEAILLLRRLWASQDAIDFEGRFWSIRNMGLPARPARPGGPLVMIGGNSPAALRRVAELGDGWLGADLGPGEARDALARLDDELQRLNRAPHEVERSIRIRIDPEGPLDRMPDAAGLAERMDEYRRAGVELLVLDVLMLDDPVEAIRWLAGEVVPRLSPYEGD